jgi:hypothetical protein
MPRALPGVAPSRQHRGQVENVDGPDGCQIAQYSFPESTGSCDPSCHPSWETRRLAVQRRDGHILGGGRWVRTGPSTVHLVGQPDA